MDVSEVLAACKDGKVFLRQPERSLRETLVRGEDGTLTMRWTWDRDELVHETPYRPDQEGIIASEFSSLYALAARGAAGLSLEDTTELIDWPQRRLTVYNLSCAQMRELKQGWLRRRAASQPDRAAAQAYLGHMADADSYVPDESVYRDYGWASFAEDDFACTAGMSLPHVVDAHDLELGSGIVASYLEDGRLVVVAFNEGADGLETYEYDPRSREYVDGGQIEDGWDLSALLQAEGLAPSWTWLISDECLRGGEDWQALVDEVAENPTALPLDEQIRYVDDVFRRIGDLWNVGRVNVRRGVPAEALAR